MHGRSVRHANNYNQTDDIAQERKKKITTTMNEKIAENRIITSVVDDLHNLDG